MQNKLAKGQIYGQLNGLRLPLKFIIIYACMHLNALPFIRVQKGHLRLLYYDNRNICISSAEGIASLKLRLTICFIPI